MFLSQEQLISGPCDLATLSVQCKAQGRLVADLATCTCGGPIPIMTEWQMATLLPIGLVVLLLLSAR
jgi:hypothetical protein